MGDMPVIRCPLPPKTNCIFVEWIGEDTRFQQPWGRVAGCGTNVKPSCGYHVWTAPVWKVSYRSCPADTLEPLESNLDSAPQASVTNIKTHIANTRAEITLLAMQRSQKAAIVLLASHLP